MNDPAGTDLERQYERIIQQTLAGVIQTAMHPRTAISVILQVLEHDGSLLACALNAASTALTDAAVPMTSMIGRHLPEKPSRPQPPSLHCCRCTLCKHRKAPYV